MKSIETGRKAFVWAMDAGGGALNRRVHLGEFGALNGQWKPTRL